MSVSSAVIGAADQAGKFLNELLLIRQKAWRPGDPVYCCLEGPDASGKTTLGIDLLKTALTFNGNAVLTRGSGSAVGTLETLTTLSTLIPRFGEYEGFVQTINSFEQALLLQENAGSSFNDRLNLQKGLFGIVNQALSGRNGGIVVSDRGVVSVIATGAEMLAKKNLSSQDFSKQLNEILGVLKPPIPDLIIYPTALLSVLQERNAVRTKPTSDKDLELRHAMMETIFSRINDQFVLRLDATRPINLLDQEIWSRTNRLMTQMG